MWCQGRVKDGSSWENHICGKLVHKCPKCGAQGCQTKDCSEQKFENDKCKKCGQQGNLHTA